MNFEWEMDIPFTNKAKWLELEVEKGKWLQFSLKEIYDVPPQHRSILGSTDSRTVFEIGFRIPFTKERSQ